MINKERNSLENSLLNDVARLKREMLQLKTTQPIGADVLSVMTIPEVAVLQGGPGTVGAGQMVTFTITFTPAGSRLTLWNILHTIAVDVADVDHMYPNGSALTTAQRSLTMSAWMDWGDSSDTTNVRVYKVTVRNTDSSPHDYYIYVRGYLPKLAGTSA